MDVVVNELVVLLLVAVEAEEAEEITLGRLTGGYGEVAVVPTFSLIPADRFRLPVRNLAVDSLRASVVGRWTVRADLRIERGGGGMSGMSPGQLRTEESTGTGNKERPWVRTGNRYPVVGPSAPAGRLAC